MAGPFGVSWDFFTEVSPGGSRAGIPEPGPEQMAQLEAFFAECRRLPPCHAIEAVPYRVGAGPSASKEYRAEAGRWLAGCPALREEYPDLAALVDLPGPNQEDAPDGSPVNCHTV